MAPRSPASFTGSLMASAIKSFSTSPHAGWVRHRPFSWTPLSRPLVLDRPHIAIILLSLHARGSSMLCSLCRNWLPCGGQPESNEAGGIIRVIIGSHQQRRDTQDWGRVPLQGLRVRFYPLILHWWKQNNFKVKN